MENKSNMGQKLADTAMSAVTGGIGGAVNGVVGMGLGWLDEAMFGQKRRDQQLEQQEKLNKLQIKGEKELGEFNLGLQKDMFDYTSPKNMVKRYQDAGLNEALMYGTSGAGGTTTGSASAGSVTGGQASDEISRKQAQIQQEGMALQMQKVASEIKVNESVAKANNAEANNKDAKTKTENDSREILVENLKQQGISQWQENAIREFLNRAPAYESEETQGYGDAMNENQTYDSIFEINREGISNKQLISAVLKTDADTGNAIAQELEHNTRAKTLIGDLLNGIANADSSRIIAKAIELKAMYETGGIVNWKSILETTFTGIGSIANLIGSVKGIGQAQGFENVFEGTEVIENVKGGQIKTTKTRSFGGKK